MASRAHRAPRLLGLLMWNGEAANVERCKTGCTQLPNRTPGSFLAPAGRHGTALGARGTLGSCRDQPSPAAPFAHSQGLEAEAEHTQCWPTAAAAVLGQPARPWLALRAILASGPCAAIVVRRALEGQLPSSRRTCVKYHPARSTIHKILPVRPLLGCRWSFFLTGQRCWWLLEASACSSRHAM